MRPTRALSYVAASLLVLAVFEACTSDAPAFATPDGPPSVAIAGISLGQAETGQGADSSVLACDHIIGVTLQLNANWQLKPPGICDGQPQCGQIRVSLLDAAGAQIGHAQLGATASIDFRIDDITTLKTIPGTYAIGAELVDDAGNVFKITDGGTSDVQKQFTISKVLSGSAECAATGNGAGGAASSEGGAAGFGGMSDLGRGGMVGEGGAYAGAGGA